MWGCCKCFVSVGRGLRSGVFNTHQPHITAAGGGGLNSFCVIYSEKPAFPYLLWRTSRSQGRCTHAGWSKSPPAQEHRAPVALVLGHCHVQAMSTSACKTLWIQIYTATEAGFGTWPIHSPLCPIASKNTFLRESSLFKGLWLAPDVRERDHRDIRAQTEICHSKWLLCIPGELCRLHFFYYSNKTSIY